MNYYGIGIAAGIIAGLILKILVSLIKKKRNGDAHSYDERQLAIRNQAYQYGFFSLLFSLAICSAIQLMGIEWCEHPLDIFLCCFFGIGVFAYIAIVKDAYFRPGDQKKSVYLIFIAVIFSQLVNVISSLDNGTLIADGVLTLRAVSVGCCGLFLFLLITLLIHTARQKNVQEDEE